MTGKHVASLTLVVAGVVPLWSCMSPGAVSESSSMRGCEYEFLATHDVGSISSLSDLPDPLRDHLEGTLRHRMGESGYSRLRFVGGDEMEPKVQTGKRQEIAVAEKSRLYVLHFLLPADDGSEGYCILIPVDARGRVQGELAVPSMATDPTKSRIISKSTALAVAVEHGAPVDTNWAEMLYVSSCDCFEWVVSYPDGREGAKVKMLNLHINSHEPRKISWSAGELYF